MPNPNWKKGAPSPNPFGRPRKTSAKPVQRMLERFMQRNLSQKKLQRLYDQLDARDKARFLIDALPYVESKKPTMASLSLNTLPDHQLDELYNQVMQGSGLLPEPDNSDVIPFTEIKPLPNEQRE